MPQNGRVGKLGLGGELSEDGRGVITIPPVSAHTHTYHIMCTHQRIALLGAGEGGGEGGRGEKVDFLRFSIDKRGQLGSFQFFHSSDTKTPLG